MIKVFIVDDHKMIIEGITALLQNEADIIICGNATTGNDCLAYFQSKTADVLLMDINLPDMNGVDLCKMIKTQYPGIQVLALSSMSQGSYIAKMIENGASGYLLKNSDKHELLDAIHAAEKGQTYFSFEVEKIHKASLEKQNGMPILTKREKEVLKLIAEGFTNTQIGQQLFLSIDTIDTHRKNLYTKLGVKNTALLIRYAIENNLLSI
jgi:DNA-binding NarL/FixJ family response regulator